MGGAVGADTGGKQAFVGVDIADADDHGIVHQRGFDRPFQAA